MHSLIIQIESIPMEEYKEEECMVLSEDSFGFTDFPCTSYVSSYWDSINKFSDDFEYVKRSLPEGMFEFNDDNRSMKYVKRPDDYIEEYANRIHSLSNSISVESIVDDRSVIFRLMKLINDNNNPIMFYSHFGDQCPLYIIDFILYVSTKCEIGDTFYIGGILDYQF